jgi:hypothetical protein
MLDFDAFTQKAFVDLAWMLGDSLVDAHATSRIDKPLMDLHILLEDRKPGWLLFRWLYWVNLHGLPPRYRDARAIQSTPKLLGRAHH